MVDVIIHSPTPHDDVPVQGDKEYRWLPLYKAETVDNIDPPTIETQKHLLVIVITVLKLALGAALFSIAMLLGARPTHFRDIDTPLMGIYHIRSMRPVSCLCIYWPCALCSGAGRVG